MKPPLSESEKTATVNASVIVLSRFSSESTTVNTALPPADATLLSKLASPICQTIEADATTTLPSLYSYETDTPSVCEDVCNVPPLDVLPQDVLAVSYTPLTLPTICSV